MSVRAGGSSEPVRLMQRPSTRRAPARQTARGPTRREVRRVAAGSWKTTFRRLRAWRSEAAGLTSCGVDRVVIVGLRLPRASGSPRPHRRRGVLEQTLPQSMASSKERSETRLMAAFGAVSACGPSRGAAAPPGSPGFRGRSTRGSASPGWRARRCPPPGAGRSRAARW